MPHEIEVEFAVKLTADARIATACVPRLGVVGLAASVYFPNLPKRRRGYATVWGSEFE